MDLALPTREQALVQAVLITCVIIPTCHLLPFMRYVEQYGDKLGVRHLSVIRLTGDMHAIFDFFARYPRDSAVGAWTGR